MFDELKTTRLTIRKFKPSDMDGLFKVLSDAEAMRYIEAPFTLEQTADFIEQCGICANPLVFALIKDKSNCDAPDHSAETSNDESRAEGRLIGHVIFHPYPDESLARKFGTAYEIGFVIAKEFWHLGIASEITGALIHYSKERGINALVLECDRDNVASIKIAEKFSFYSITTADSPGASLLTFILPL